MEAGLSVSEGRNPQTDSPLSSAGGHAVARELWAGEVHLFLTQQQVIALQAAADRTRTRSLEGLVRDVIWGMATDLLEDAGVSSGDSGPTTYDKVTLRLISEEVGSGQA